MTKPVTPQDMFDLWQKMVNPGAYPLQSLMFPVTDPAELDKKIAELETVEHWLKANLNMLQLSIKSLEFQRQLAKGGERARRAASGEAEASPGVDATEALNPALWAMNLMQQAAQGAGKKAASSGPRAKAGGRAKRR